MNEKILHMLERNAAVFREYIESRDEINREEAFINLATLCYLEGLSQSHEALGGKSFDGIRDTIADVRHLYEAKLGLPCLIQRKANQ